jgi:hypothetical protein
MLYCNMIKNPITGGYGVQPCDRSRANVPVLQSIRRISGYAAPDYNGGYRFYDQYGGYEGRSTPDYNGGYRFYNQYGGYQGRLGH